ncbi:MAG: TetR/AcrR family transcriptional regulator [Euryarchaeota archaeon]|nr:TetR/AcrR family transcriptional regulator [Euryarchaeota archaeon]
MSETERKGSLERQNQIIEAALDIIDKEGIHSLTLKSIGSAIGISDAALLRHFRSKEEIVEATAQRVFFECVVPEETTRSDDVGTILSQLIRNQFEKFDSFPQSTAVLFQEDIFREYPEIRAWFIERRNDRKERISGLIRKRTDLGQIDRSVDPDVFATIFMGAMRMEVMEWRDSGYSWSLRSRADPLLEQLLGILR